MLNLNLESIIKRANYIRSVFHFLWYHQDKYPSELIEKINHLRAKQWIFLWNDYQWRKPIQKNDPRFYMQAEKDFEDRSLEKWNKILNN